jgi:hypothetical protein
MDGPTLAFDGGIRQRKSPAQDESPPDSSNQMK